MVWKIYGNEYDLTDMMNNHPGGNDILRKTKDEDDITILFETYHAFSNKEYIKNKLNNFLVKNKNDKDYIYTFDSYNELTMKIREVLPNRRSIKAGKFFYIRNLMTVFMYLISMYYGFFSIQINIFMKCIFSFVSGVLFISLGFNLMHDGSHYAISTNSYINELVANIWTTIALWNNEIWFYHHVYNHHSFTNVVDKDPDLYNFRPVLKKIQDNRSFNFSKKYISYIAIVFIFIFPGMFCGQTFMYILSTIKNRLFKIKIPNKTYYNHYNILCFILFGYIFIYNQKSLYPVIMYLLALNITYAINIVPDHDTFETHIENHYNGNDWLKLQICNSGNFENNNILWTYLFGGINFQIEHHLFPNMCHEHYPIIKPIVKKYCLDNNIPYQEHSLFSAFKSFLKMTEFYAI